MIQKRVGNWVLKGYYNNGNKKYWVYDLPYMETMLEFNDLQKAKEYFNYTWGSAYAKLQEALSDQDRSYLDRWHDFTLGQVLGGSIAQVTNNILDNIENLGQISNTITNGVGSVFGWADAVQNEVFNKSDQALTTSVNFLDTLTESLDLLKFSIFVIPKATGGLDRLRYLSNRWIDPQVPDTPDYPPNTLFLPIILNGANPFLDLSLIINTLFKQGE
jgi:hypothetical protein